MINYARQNINQADIDEVVRALKSNYLTQGPILTRFETALAKKVGVKYAVAVNSASSALHVACLALDLGPGDVAWTSPNTFVASANCVLHCRANIDFVDIDPRTYNIDIDLLSKKLALAKSLDKLPKVVIPVHFAGQPCDMIAIHRLSKKYGFKIIEDASHALGASYNNIKVGSCKHSDITILSFHPVKIITTGEGGMLLTNNYELFKKACRIRTHGITKKILHKREKDEIWNYQQIELGFNYRMTDIQAALGLSQLKRLNRFIKRRKEIARYYDKELEELPVVRPWQLQGTSSSFHLYPILIKKNLCKKKQKYIYNQFIKKKIIVNLHYIPVHRQPFYENLGFKKKMFPKAEQYFKEVITLPMHCNLTTIQLKYIVKVLNEILK
jgi:UDP-4-amino-4,6-dideoxy-N-acetyl-beta-L-altrosamine transaminase